MAFEVKRLLFIETGAYHKQSARPYHSYMDDERNIAALRNATQDGNNISANSVAGVASSLIRPASEAGRDINIFNGWGERRYRFFMEIEMMVAGTPTRKIIIGYTDEVGVSFGGNLNPDMRMFINNVIVLRLIGPNQWQIFESNHLVVNDLLVHGTGFSSQNVVMRPEDVFNTLQATNMYPGEAVKMYDFRPNISTGVRKSERGNTNHNHYLAKSMKALHTAQNNADYQKSRMADIFSEATTKVRESSVDNDIVLRDFDDHGGFFQEGFITYGLLCDLSPSTHYVTEHFELKPAIRQQTSHTEYTQNFAGSDVRAIMSTILANTVPPLVMECLLTRVQFAATTATLNGQVDARITAVPKGFVSDIPLDQYLNLFLDRLINIVMPDVTNNFNYTVTINMDVDILGETRIEINTGDDLGFVPYVIPSFADGLTSPIIGNNSEDLVSLASDINTATSNLGLTLDTSGQIFSPANGGGKW